MDHPGDAVLEITRVAGRSVVARAAARSPLQLLLPRNHGDAVWAFLSSLGGGLVDGDRVALRVTAGPGAAALLSTQASTKVYRSPRGCAQRVTAEVGAGGVLVVLPDPVACFAGARLEQALAVELAADATLVAVDAVTCGRAARGERWDLARYRSALTVTRAGAGVLRDVIELDPAHGTLAARMGRFDALATIVATGPRAPPSPCPPPPAAPRGWPRAARSPTAARSCAPPRPPPSTCTAACARCSPRCPRCSATIRSRASGERSPRSPARGATGRDRAATVRP